MEPHLSRIDLTLSKTIETDWSLSQSVSFLILTLWDQTAAHDRLDFDSITTETSS